MLLTTNRTYKMYVETLDFDNAVFPRKEVVELEFSNLELLHAIVTCGMPIQHLSASSAEQRRMELVNKCWLVEMALEADGEYLKRSERTYFLDPSEKSMISYYLGMIFTKLISGRVFFVDYLTHITAIQRQAGFHAIGANTPRRSDFIGYRIRHDHFSVWEAKGRIQYSLEALESGYLQAREVSAVNGGKPKYGAVCMTYYDSGNLTAQVKDPEGTGNVELHFLQGHFYQAYYQHICELYKEKVIDDPKDIEEIESSDPKETDPGDGGASEMKWLDTSITLPKAVWDEPLLHAGSSVFKTLQREEPRRTICIGIPDKIYEAVKKNDGEHAFVTTQEKNLWKSWCPDTVFMGNDGICIKIV